ncbi:MAG: proline--tRNA ligase [Deltaproteobacteria bacterium]|nr:proline--tRNA ligase [Deltaproteobacteria bacterium]
MGKKLKTAITPTREENYPEWYQQVIKAADMAQNSPVRGCMVIKPWGWAIWENVQKHLDRMFKETGHVNAYFPLFIPLSYLQREADHVEGFAKECAVVTHHRLEAGPDGKLVPSGPLEEPLIIRPTSETIIGEMYAKWVQSYRDLPVLINQWANVVRWEMRPRIFLRTAEFLWQEGHTAHATAEEAREETMRMLNVYADFAENYMAIPAVKGEKSEAERFPGAVATYSIEAMMQDRKALQAGTSHFLGQNFAKASQIKFLSFEGKEEFAWTTSWGVSTRLIGGLIMTHSDDNGLAIPPRLAPIHVVILPVLHKDETKQQVMEYCEGLKNELKEKLYDGEPVRVELDLRDMQGGEKAWLWVKKGVPVIVEIGPKEVENNSVFAGRRDRDRRERTGTSRDEFVNSIGRTLSDIQNCMLEKAIACRDENTVRIESKDDFISFFTPKNQDQLEIHGGFALVHWCGERELEEQIAKEYGVSIRNIPFDLAGEEGTCIFTGKKSRQRVLFAKSY